MVFVKKYKNDVLIERGRDEAVTIQEFNAPHFRTFLTDLLESYMTDVPFLRKQLNAMWSTECGTKHSLGIILLGG